MDVVEPLVRILHETNNTMGPCENNDLWQPCLLGIQDLWHPYMLMFFLHCINCGVFGLLSLYAPIVTACIMVASGAIFAVSAIFRIQLWGNDPGSFQWIGFFAKWLIVNLAATVPVLLMRARTFSKRCVNISGICIYFILGSNVVWTMFMPPRTPQEAFIVYVNRTAGGMLTIALVIHCIGVCKAGYNLYEVRSLDGGNFPYGFGTSFWWIFCYTIWNFLFAARIGVGTTLQDFLFWGLMFFYRWWDGVNLPIELYFGFARPVQLGSYIAFSEFIGGFVPYFSKAPILADVQPLPFYSNSYVLFIATGNMVLSFFVVGWAVQRLICGLGFFQSRFEEVHKVEEDDESKTALVDDEEWEYEDEEEAEEE